ncbi:MAG: T9SS type A sorting domain-containing protein [Bacteroidales bacterium]|nr:T9SS type A sorting domain-containing protein [Bacteroidales bacterium]
MCLGNSDLQEPWLYHNCQDILSTKTNEWEDLVFNMKTCKDSINIDQIIFSVNSGIVEDEIEWYLDEIGGPLLNSKPPKLISAEKIVPNNTIALQFDKMMSPTVYPNNFSVEIDGIQTTIKEIYIKPENTNTIMIVLDRAIQESEEITLSYYKASDKNITSVLGSALESFSDKSVKNLDLQFQLYNDYEGTQYGVQFYFNQSTNTLGSVVPNPSKSAINQSANVSLIEKPIGIDYSGTGILLDSKIDLVKNSTFMVNVYGKAGTTLRLKLINDEIVGDEKYTYYSLDRFYTIKESDTWELAVFNFYTDMNATEMNKINLELIGANSDLSIYIDNILGPKMPNPPAVTEVPIYVNITTDQMGSETYWKITDASDETKVYAQNGPYINAPLQFKHTVYVPAETNLLFTIFDKAGNGIKSQVYGNGEYNFATSCGVVKTGGAFNDVEQTPFTSPVAISTLSNYDKVIGTTGIANNEMANSIIQTCDGGYLLVGAKNKASKSDYDLYITHTNSAGEILWEKTIDTAKNEYASVIKELNDGSYLVIGRAEAIGADKNSCGFVAKIKLDGTIVYKVLLNASDVSATTSLYDAVVLSDGSILICGTKNDDIFLIKLAKNAVVLKTMELPRPENQVATKVSILSDSTFLIGGYTSVDDFSPKQAFLSVINKWLEEKSYTKIFNETTSSVESFSVYNDTILVVGQKTGKMYVALLNKELNILKEKSYSANIASSIVQLNDKTGFAVAGVDTKNIFLLKINNNGDSVWMSVFDKYEIASSKVSVSQTMDNGFVLAGTVKNNGNDMYLIKTNMNGCGNTPFLDQICAVTKSSTEKNLIAWERTQGKGTVSYNVFRESDFTGKYDKIGSVNFNAIAGVFIDRMVDPDVQAYKYKISTVDKCGNESPMSAAHRTMHLSVSESSQFNNAFELRWDHYEGADFGTYKFYKGSSDKDLREFASIQYDPNISAYTDKNLLSNNKYTYRVSAEFTNECKSQLFKSDSGPFSQSLSNIAEAQLQTSTEKIVKEDVTVFPNPAASMVRVQFAAKGNYTVSISDIAGQQIGNDTKIINRDFIDLDVSNLEIGVYNLCTWVNNKKVCIQLLKKEK